MRFFHKKLSEILIRKVNIINYPASFLSISAIIKSFHNISLMFRLIHGFEAGIFKYSKAPKLGGL